MILTSTLATLPDERAALDPTAACIDDDRLALTNAEFLARVKATATMLARRRARPWRRDRDDADQPRRARRRHVRRLADRSRAHADQPEPDGRRGRVPDRGLRRPPGRPRRSRARHRRRDDGRRDDAARDPERRRGRHRDRARRAGPAHLHERHDRQAQGGDARPRQPHRDGRHDHHRAGRHRRRPLLAHPAAVPRQRHPRQRAVAACRRRLHDDHRSLLTLDVLRHRRSGPPDLLLRRTGDLRHARARSPATSIRTPRRCASPSAAPLPCRPSSSRGSSSATARRSSRATASPSAPASPPSTRSTGPARPAPWGCRCPARKSPCSTPTGGPPPTVRAR